MQGRRPAFSPQTVSRCQPPLLFVHHCWLACDLSPFPRFFPPLLLISQDTPGGAALDLDPATARRAYADQWAARSIRRCAAPVWPMTAATGRGSGRS
jgi:hypothetical protein